MKYSLNLNKDAYSTSGLEKFLRKYCINAFESLIPFFNLFEIMDGNMIRCDIKPFTKQLFEDPEVNSVDYCYTFSKCWSCQCVDYFSLDEHELNFRGKCKEKYARNAMNFGFKEIFKSPQQPNSFAKLGQSFPETKQEPSELAHEFGQTFGDNLKYLGLIDTVVKIKDTNKVFDDFKQLLRIDFNNNSLESLPDSMLGVKSLAMLCLLNNPITQLPKSFRSLENFQVLEIFRLPLRREVAKERIGLPCKFRKLEVTSAPLDQIPFDFTDCINSMESLSFIGVDWHDMNSPVYKFSYDLERIAEMYKHLLTEAEVKERMDKADTVNVGFIDDDDIIKFNAGIFCEMPRLGRQSKSLYFFYLNALNVYFGLTLFISTHTLTVRVVIFIYLFDSKVLNKIELYNFYKFTILSMSKINNTTVAVDIHEDLSTF